MPKSDTWPGGIAMESLTNMDSAGSCDSVVSMNSGFSDDSLDHLSAEERACLLFLEETIESLEMEEDSDLASDEPDPSNLAESFPPSISPMVQTSQNDATRFQHGENVNVPKPLLPANDCPCPLSRDPGGDSETKTDVALQTKTVVIPTYPKTEAAVEIAAQGQASSLHPAGTVPVPASVQDPATQLHSSKLAADLKTLDLTTNTKEPGEKSATDLPGQLNSSRNSSPVSGPDLKASPPATLHSVMESSLPRKEVESNLKIISADSEANTNDHVNLDVELIPPPSDFRDEPESELEQGPAEPDPEKKTEPPAASGPSAQVPLTCSKLEQLRKKASMKKAPLPLPATPDPPSKLSTDLPGSTSAPPSIEALACPVSEATEPRSPPAVAPKPKKLPPNIILKSHKATMVNPDGYHATSNFTPCDKVMMDPQKVRREALLKLGLLKSDNIESGPLRGQTHSRKAKSSSLTPTPQSTSAPVLAKTQSSMLTLASTPVQKTAPPPTPILDPNPAPNTSPHPAQIAAAAPTLVPAPTFPTAPYQATTTPPAPIPDQAPTTTPAPIPVQSPTTPPVPIPVQAPTTTPAPIPDQAPTTPPAPIPDQAPTTPPAPIPDQAPTTTPAPVPDQVPTTTPAPVPDQVPTTPPAPVPVQAPTTTPAPIPDQAPTTIPDQVPTTPPAPIPDQVPTTLPAPIPDQVPTTPPAPVQVQAPTTTPAPIPDQVPTTLPPPIPDQVPTTPPAPVPVQAPTTTPAPIPDQAPTTTPDPIPDQVPTTLPAPIPVQAPTTIPDQAPTTPPAPIPDQAPTTTPAPIPDQAPTTPPAPIPDQAPTTPPAPIPDQAPTTPPAPIPDQAPTTTPDPIPEQVRTTLPAPIPVQAPTTPLVPIPDQAPTTPPAPIPDQVPTTPPAPIPDQAPTTTPDPIPEQVPTTLPAPIPVQAPTTPLVPIPDQAPTTPPAPIPDQAPTTPPAPIPDQAPTTPPAPIPVPGPTQDTTSVPTPAPLPASDISLVSVIIPAPAAFIDHDEDPELTVLDSPPMSVGVKSVTLERSDSGLNSYIASQASGEVHLDTTADLSPGQLLHFHPQPDSLGSGKDSVQAGALHPENRKSLNMTSVLEPSGDQKLPRSSGISVLICPRGENGFDRREALKKLGLLRN